MQRVIKKSFWSFFVGGLIGGLISTWVAPNAIAWYFDPPVPVGVSCKESIEWALHRLQMSQLFGILSGGVVAMILGFALIRKKEDPLSIG